MKKPVIALMYDFDRTLCAKDMQEYSFIPSVGMEASAVSYTHLTLPTIA